MVKKPLTTEEREKIFSETEVLLHKKAFQDAVVKESKREMFFSHITVNFINEDRSYQFLCQTRDFNRSVNGASKWVIIDIGKSRTRGDTK